MKGKAIIESFPLSMLIGDLGVSYKYRNRSRVGYRMTT